MILEFLGAAHEVTGSCHYVEVGEKKFLVDCGMEQGADIYENQEIPVQASVIDYVFVTHAHIDHSGLLPLLYAHGFRGQIYATEATTELCNIMLKDSAHIQTFEAEWKNRKARRAGKAEVTPLYTMEDAAGITLDNFSLRSSPGTNLGYVHDDMIRRFDRARHYDLVILIYGLNVATPNGRDYDYYRTAMKKTIAKPERPRIKSDQSRHHRQAQRVHARHRLLAREYRRPRRARGWRNAHHARRKKPGALPAHYSRRERNRLLEPL